jgi:hypothetical protein
MKLKIVLLILASTIINHLSAQTIVPALIKTNQNWTASGSPYIINQNTLIENGVSVIVSAGAEVVGAGNTTQLMVDGELQIVGTASSKVDVSGLIISYSDKSKDYDKSTGQGAFITHAEIEGNGVAKVGIGLNSTSILITNSKIYDAYYAIQSLSGSDSLTIVIDSSEISGVRGTGNYHQGTVLYLNSPKTETYLTNSIVSYGRGVDTRGYLFAHRNVFYQLEDIEFDQTTNLDITCNLFNRIRQGVIIDLTGKDSVSVVTFEDNTLDSFTTRTDYDHMFTLRNLLNTIVKPQLNIQNNNFLSGFKKIRITGNNPNMGSSQSLDFTNNYWGTTDTSIIDTMITDYNDNITLYGLVDYSNYLTTANPVCVNIDPCPTPNFLYQIDGTEVMFNDSSSNLGSTSRIWNFGDGTSDTVTNALITHDYDSVGSFTACLYVLNYNGTVCDSFCQTITTSGTSTFCSASYYVAKDTATKFVMYVVNNSKRVGSNATYEWKFGDGSTSTSATPQHTYQEFGNYELCLTIRDDSRNCLSEFCDTIGMDSDGKYYKAEGFSINVLDERDILDVEELNALNNVMIYPNPSTGQFAVSLKLTQPEDVQVEIYNLVGESVYRNQVYTNQMIPVNAKSLNNGMYILQVCIGEYKINRRIVIER